MPPNTIKIDRSTKWGNPFKVDHPATHPVTGNRIVVKDKQEAINLFALYLKSSDGRAIAAAARDELKRRNLSCWCKEGAACHGDVLLRIANPRVETRRAA